MNFDDIVNNERWIVIIGNNGFSITNIDSVLVEALQKLDNAESLSFDDLGEALDAAYERWARRCIQLHSGPIENRAQFPMYPPINKIAFYAEEGLINYAGQ